MATSEVILHFVFSDASNSDLRTFRVYRPPDDSSGEDVELYRFYHPVTGLSTGMTTFHRQNLATGVFETAGQIDWLSNYNATVYFGLDEVHVRDLRKAKKPSSQSRRFKAGGSECKWKMTDNATDLTCVDSKGKVIASWIEDRSTLHVSPKWEGFLDRLVVTCFLNLWFRHLGQW